MIKIQDSNSTLEKFLLREFIRFSLITLMIPENSIMLRLILRDNLYKFEGYPGFTFHPRDDEFLIEIDSKYKLSQKMKILAHELIHIQQYLTGDLKDLAGDRVYWKGTIYRDSHDYPEPWEREADRRKDTLCRRFEQHCRKLKINIF
jgi:hypothetical protein